MEVFFCDICNESVPVNHLDEGKAFRRKDRVVCAQCDAAMSGGSANPGSPAPESGLFAHRQVAQEAPVGAPAGRGGGAIWVALLSLVFTCAAFYLLGKGQKQHSQDLEDGRRDLVGLEQRLRLDRVERRKLERDVGLDLRALESELGDGLNQTAEQVSAQLGLMRQELQEGFGRLDGLESGLAELREQAGERSEQLTARLNELGGQLTSAGQELDFIGERVGALEEVIADGGLLAVDAGAAAAGPREPGWFASLPELESEDPGARWNAVQALAESGDPAVIEHLIPMLKDSDVFVRMAAAGALGDLAAVDAVGGLIDSLEDSESAVRERAARSLRTITGRDFRFDPLASEAERAKRVKAWRKWWEKAQEEGVG